MTSVFIRTIVSSLWLFFSLSSISHASVKTTGRHVYIVHGSLDKVMGSYLFLVENTEKEDKFGSIPVMLPKNVLEFLPGEGVTADQIKLNDNGDLSIEKTFSPGEQLVSINFSIKASGGEAGFEVTAKEPVGNLKVMTPSGSLTFLANKDIFKSDTEVPFSKRTYNTISATNLPTGKTVTFKVEGVSEGRGRFWVLGSIVAAISLILLFGVVFLKEKKGTHPEFTV